MVGSTDFSIVLITCCLENQENEDSSYQGAFSNITSYGDRLLEFAETGSWVEGIAFNPSGQKASFTVHDGTV